MKRFTVLIGLLFLLTFTLVGCGQNQQGNTQNEEEIPEVNLGYIFTNHQTPLLVAAANGEAFKDMGTYLKEVVPREKYELMSDGKKLADINLVVTKSGSETTTLFAQGNLDVALGSVTAFIQGVDQNVPIKVLCPIQTEGMGLVVPKDSKINDWNSFAAYVEEAEQPVKIGYHSPTSGPKIVFEGALHKAGISATQDPNDMNAEILLVDLKDTANLNSALTSKQVDGWVGPAPFPEVAVTQGLGKVALELRDLPPVGEWYDFPCCVVGAHQDFIDQNPQVTEAIMEIMTNASEWCNQNKDKAGAITAEWIGIPVEAAKASTLVYNTDPSEEWMSGVGVYIDILNDMDKFEGQLKDKTLNDDVKKLLFDFSFIEER
ncbi:Nitrate transport protein NrtA precursor [Sporotomaculum syntrophicum]|uniref:Nitrate transport protein NrtA n=1 Tax=Sporotomaculum syntrophicum TaxID=182264 RepID=A0A9D2WNU5_9FIRM|nr:ABC transporter substrate-binding protein [Sporotomaculum syntrophicum]KAF1084166.1 Nitrate transport protein NrtA precursor [Sporotomaculum syntrophicum]